MSHNHRGRIRAALFPAALAGLLLCGCGLTAAKASPIRITLAWNKIVATSKSTVSIQACVEPPMRRGHPIHDALFAALRNLHANDAKLQPWYPYPRLAVAELHPPADGKTSWDFSQIDPIVEDFMQAAHGRPVLFNFGTVPAWMYKTARSDAVPEDPDSIDWRYSVNPDFTDFASTVKLFAEYQARLASWYIRGGFRDEYGRWHASGHRYTNIAYWEVPNEPNSEHDLTPRQLTELYDAVVSAVRTVAPDMKFVGPAIGASTTRPDYLIYFLNPANHQPGIPIDAVSYHFYYTPESDESLEVMDHTAFDSMEELFSVTRYLTVVRNQLSPHSQMFLDELGAILPGAGVPRLASTIPDWWWNLSGAMWAYAYGHLASMGINLIVGSELIDYPGQVASNTLVNWNTGRPNARYWVLVLLRDNFEPGDRIIAPRETIDVLKPVPGAQVYAQGFITPQGARKVLLVDKRDQPVAIALPGAAGGSAQIVDRSTTSGPETRALSSDAMVLPGLAVEVVTLSKRASGGP